jgi:hypothetical protein
MYVKKPNGLGFMKKLTPAAANKEPAPKPIASPRGRSSQIFAGSCSLHRDRHEALSTSFLLFDCRISIVALLLLLND